MAAVLAVKACVQSAPYDIPPWLGPLLVGLLRAAKAPQPLRSIVRCAHPCHPGNVMLRCPECCMWVEYCGGDASFRSSSTVVGTPVSVARRLVCCASLCRVAKLAKPPSRPLTAKLSHQHLGGVPLQADGQVQGLCGWTLESVSSEPLPCMRDRCTRPSRHTCRRHHLSMFAGVGKHWQTSGARTKRQSSPKCVSS